MCPPVAGRMIDSKQCSAMFSIMWKQWNQARGDDGSKERDWALAPNNMLCNKATVTSEVWGRPRAFVIYHWNMNDRQMEFLIFVFLCISRHSRSFHNLITPQKWSCISLNSSLQRDYSYHIWHPGVYGRTGQHIWRSVPSFSPQSMTEMLSSTRSSLLRNAWTKGSALPLWCRRTVVILLFALCFREMLSCVEFGGLFKTSTAS